MVYGSKTEPSELDWLQKSIGYDTLMKICIKDWSQSRNKHLNKRIVILISF